MFTPRRAAFASNAALCYLPSGRLKRWYGGSIPRVGSGAQGLRCSWVEHLMGEGMGLWSWFSRCKPTHDANRDAPVVARQREEQKPLTPEQMADLKDAWAELAEAADASAATGFHACSRGGKSWQEDPAAVRTVAALLRNAGKEDAGPEAAPARLRHNRPPCHVVVL